MRPHDSVRLARGCWVTPVQNADFRARCIAVLASSAPDSVVSSVTAARVHGLWLPTLRDERIHVATAEPGAVAAQMTRTRRPQLRAHRHRPADIDRCVVDGVAAMSITRTWLDLGRTLSFPDLVAAGDSALRSGVSHAELAEVVARSWHVPGVVAARAALPLLDERSRSRPETHLRLAVHIAGVPRFEVNESVFRDRGRGWLAEPDLSLAAAKIAIEYIGEPHGKIGRRRKDISRTVDMRREFWLVCEFGPAEVFGAPWEIGPEILQHVRDRAPQLLGPRPPRRPNGARR